MTLKLGYGVATLFFLAFFAVTLALQVSAKTYHRFLYWGVILATTMVGTTISDMVDRTLGLGYVRGALLLSATLAATLGAWHLTTGSVAIAKMTTKKSEVFYWVTILISNTLGTALGDFLADSAKLGYEGGALVVSAALALIGLAYFKSTVPRTALFWLAFVLTRPLGATVGDLLTKSHAKGGLDLGTAPSSLVVAAVLLVLVALSTKHSEQYALEARHRI